MAGSGDRAPALAGAGHRLAVAAVEEVEAALEASPDRRPGPTSTRTRMAAPFGFSVPAVR